MMTWIGENIGTIAVCALLLAAIAAIVASLFRDKKRGKHACGGSCAHCAMCGACSARK